jgi:hypothetical protein
MYNYFHISYFRDKTRWSHFSGRPQPTFFCIRSLSIMCITAIGRYWGPAIPTSARIWIPGPERFPHPLRPSDSDFSQNWKPGTREISPPIEVQWFRLQPEFESQDRRDSPTHWGSVIQTSARIGSPGQGRFPHPLSSDSDFSQNWKPRTEEIPPPIEVQWFRLQPELEAQDRGDSPTLTGGGWAPVRSSDSDFGQNWKPRTGEIPYSLRLGTSEV